MTHAVVLVGVSSCDGEIVNVKFDETCILPKLFMMMIRNYVPAPQTAGSLKALALSPKRVHWGAHTTLRRTAERSMHHTVSRSS